MFMLRLILVLKQQFIDKHYFQIHIHECECEEWY